MFIRQMSTSDFMMGNLDDVSVLPALTNTGVPSLIIIIYVKATTWSFCLLILAPPVVKRRQWRSGVKVVFGAVLPRLILSTLQ